MKYAVMYLNYNNDLVFHKCFKKFNVNGFTAVWTYESKNAKAYNHYNNAKKTANRISNEYGFKSAVVVVDGETVWVNINKDKDD